MANLDKPRGAKVVGHLDGSPFNGMAGYYLIPAADGTATFIGDFVKSGGSADADGIPDVAQAAAGDALLGVVLSVAFDPTDLRTIHRKASTKRYVYVADAPDIVVEMQEDAVGGALAAADIGNNADIVVAAGDATTGQSAMEIDSSTKATTTAQLRILKLVQRPDNELSANALYLCAINEHEHKSTTGT